jgi:hypothetical protein
MDEKPRVQCVSLYAGVYYAAFRTMTASNSIALIHILGPWPCSGSF